MNTQIRAASAPEGIQSKREVLLGRAFVMLEADIRDLTRIGRLAQLQLHEAIGELRSDDDGNPTEPPEKEAAELATFVVDQVADMTRRFEEMYDRAYKEAHMEALKR